MTEGGLKMVNVIDIQKSVYLQWAGKLFEEPETDWSIIPIWHINKVLNNKDAFLMNCKAKDANVLENTDNEFWREVIATYLANKKQTKLEDIDQAKL